MRTEKNGSQSIVFPFPLASLQGKSTPDKFRFPLGRQFKFIIFCVRLFLSSKAIRVSFSFFFSDFVDLVPARRRTMAANEVTGAAFSPL
jgi:hypothetical protein